MILAVPWGSRSHKRLITFPFPDLEQKAALVAYVESIFDGTLK